MGIFDEMRERDERRVESFSGSDAPILVDRQHSLQDVDEFSTVRLFSQQLGPLQVGRDVDLNGD